MEGKVFTMSWIIVFLLIGFWIAGLVSGYSYDGLIHILLVYAGLMVIAWWIKVRRYSRSSENSQTVAGNDLNPKQS